MLHGFLVIYNHYKHKLQIKTLNILPGMLGVFIYEGLIKA